MPGEGEDSINQLLLGLRETGDGEGPGPGHLDKTKEAGSCSPPGLGSLLPGGWVAKPPTGSGSQLLHPPDKNSRVVICSRAAAILDPHNGRTAEGRAGAAATLP